jgi:hypothetical protein
MIPGHERRITMEQFKLQRIEIKPNECGYDITIDGKEMKNVTRIFVDMQAGEVTRVELEVKTSEVAMCVDGWIHREKVSEVPSELSQAEDNLCKSDNG